MSSSPINASNNQPEDVDLSDLVNAVSKAVVKARQSDDIESALTIRDELHRLPNSVMTEVLNQVMLQLVQLDPMLCRWFIVDVFLRDADPEGRADVAERINLLMVGLQSSG